MIIDAVTEKNNLNPFMAQCTCVNQMINNVNRDQMLEAESKPLKPKPKFCLKAYIKVRRSRLKSKS